MNLQDHQYLVFNDGKRVFNFLKKNRQRKIINFLNSHDLYLFSTLSEFKKVVTQQEDLNLVDGFVIQKFLMIRYFKKIKRWIGAEFTRALLSSSLAKERRHFFIGVNTGDAVLLKKRFHSLGDVFSYNPPFIKEYKFSAKEVRKIAKKINQFRPDYVWVAIGSPKQNFLSHDLFPLTKARYFLNVGAAIDFVLGKKKEAPSLIRKIGLEWLYRFFTDFNHSKKKVWRSLMALRYLLKNAKLK